MSERAVIYVPAGREANRWREVCMLYCANRGYEVVGVVTAPRNVGRWRDVRAMARRDALDVLVAARRDHLPAGRRPRIEVVEEQPRSGRPPARRPRVLR